MNTKRNKKGQFLKGYNGRKGKKHTKEAKVKMSKAKWKGGRTKRYGYILIHRPEHPYAIGGYVREHRVVMEYFIKRYLEPQEVVHHRNGIKTDNRISNLMLFKNEKEHRKYHNSRRSKQCV